MSMADLLKNLDTWLGDAEAPPANLIKPDIAYHADTTPAQRASHIKRRKEIWEALHPAVPGGSNCATRSQGGKTIPTPGGEQKIGFASETAPDVAADAEAQLCEARALAFTAKGVPSDEADRLACSLMRRDRQLDDRRSCAECMSFHAGRCLQRITPIGETTLHTLHRCKGFKLSEVTHD